MVVSIPVTAGQYHRNGWSPSSESLVRFVGFGGQLPPESLVSFRRIRWSAWAGIRTDSIPLKILRDIGTSRLIFADITSDSGTRNPNVMYELGIAQAVRQPEEVLVFRSDDDTLPFDIAPILADTYHPDAGPGATKEAIERIKSACERAIAGIDLTRHLIVQRIVDSLDVPTFEALAASFLPGPIPDQIGLGSAARYPRQLSGVSRLVSIGVLKSIVPDLLASRDTKKQLAETLTFEVTPCVFRPS